MQDKTLKFIIAVGIQVSILLFIILIKLSILSSGTPVYLSIEPVDPRHPFRGDYLVFRYKNLSKIPYYKYKDLKALGYDSYNAPYDFEYISNNKKDKVLKAGDKVYVVFSLRKTEPYVYSVLSEYPKNLREGDYVIKGTVKKVSYSYRGKKKPKDILVTYGIEQYYIPEGTGAGLNLKNAVAKVIIDDKGTPVLKKVFTGK